MTFTPSLPTARVVLYQSIVVAAVFLALAITPAPVTFPSTPWQAVLLAKGALALILANALVVRSAPHTASQPRHRKLEGNGSAVAAMSAYVDYHVTEDGEVIGVVDQVVAGRRGEVVGFLVAHGWVRARRFFVGLAEVEAVDDAARVMSVVPRTPRGGRSS